MGTNDIPVPVGRTVTPEEHRDKIIALADVLEVNLVAVETASINYERMDDGDWPLVEHLIALVEQRFPTDADHRPRI